MSEKNYFILPDSPEEFSVNLDPANLKRIDFSALDYPMMRRALIEYVKTYYPDRFNDFVANNGIIMILELVAYVGSVLSARSDVIADESFLPTAQTEKAVENHLYLINQKIKRQTPAIVDIEISLNTPIKSELRIQPGIKFNINGADGEPVVYELYKSPGDFTSYLSIPPGKRGVIGFGIEGSFAEPLTYQSVGGSNQEIFIEGDNVLDDPVILTVRTGSEDRTWRRVDNINEALPTDTVYEVRYVDGGMTVIVGDDNSGKSLLPGQIATVRYRVGGGIRGRISANIINRIDYLNPQPPASAAVEVNFRNISPSNGGTDKETIESAKKRAPKEAATLKSATTKNDYSILASNFKHNVYGSVLKSIATVRTSINANIVEIYVLAGGPNDTPVLPNSGLKAGLKSYFDNIKVLTDEIRILDGVIKYVDFEAHVVVNKISDPSVVKSNVENAIYKFFGVDNFDMGTPLYLSNLYEIIQKVDGVKVVDIFAPKDNILPSGNINNEDDSKIGLNEYITLGELRLRFYSEL